jgi:hypothetical protein
LVSKQNQTYVRTISTISTTVGSVVKKQRHSKRTKNEAVEEAGSSIFSGLQKIAAEGGVEQLASLFQGDNAQNASNL